MNIEPCSHEKGTYLLATITDTVITPHVAKSILKSINVECKKLNCQKVLLDEMTVEKRDVEHHELRAITDLFPKVSMAFLCRPELIDQKAKLFCAFTFSTKYLAKHFSVKEEAVNWLMSARSD